MGFLPKWLTINNLISNKFFLVRFILIVSTLITLFFYLRISFSRLAINLTESKLFNQEKTKNLMILVNFLSLKGLIICTLMYNTL